MRQSSLLLTTRSKYSLLKIVVLLFYKYCIPEDSLKENENHLRLMFCFFTGMPLSLVVGTEYGKQLALNARKPFIPIHHMEAHALTVRMVEQVI